MGRAMPSESVLGTALSQPPVRRLPLPIYVSESRFTSVAACSQRKRGLFRNIIRFRRGQSNRRRSVARCRFDIAGVAVIDLAEGNDNVQTSEVESINSVGG